MWVRIVGAFIGVSVSEIATRTRRTGWATVLHCLHGNAAGRNKIFTHISLVPMTGPLRHEIVRAE